MNRSASKKHLSAKGFSVVEMMVAATLVIVLSLLLCSVMASAYRTWRLYRDQALVLESLTIDLRNLVEHCRIASSLSVTNDTYIFSYPEMVGGVSMETNRNDEFSRIMQLNVSIEDGCIVQEIIRKASSGVLATNWTTHIPLAGETFSSIVYTDLAITNVEDRCRLGADVEYCRTIFNTTYTNLMNYHLWFRMYNKR